MFVAESKEEPAFTPSEFRRGLEDFMGGVKGVGKAAKKTQAKPAEIEKKREELKRLAQEAARKALEPFSKEAKKQQEELTRLTEVKQQAGYLRFIELLPEEHKMQIRGEDKFYDVLTIEQGKGLEGVASVAGWQYVTLVGNTKIYCRPESPEQLNLIKSAFAKGIAVIKE